MRAIRHQQALHEKSLSQREHEHETMLLALLRQTFPAASEPSLREAVLAMQLAASITRHTARMRKVGFFDPQDRTELRAFQYRATARLAAFGADAALKFRARLDTGGSLTVTGLGKPETVPLLVPASLLTERQRRTRQLIERPSSRMSDLSNGVQDIWLPKTGHRPAQTGPMSH